MNTLSLLLAGLVAFSASSQAETKSPFEFGTKSSTMIKSATLSENAKLTFDGKTVELKRVASGLRYKKIAFITANVYAGQIFSNATVDKASLEALKASLMKSLPFAMTLTFVRDVGAEKLSDAFKETLSDNGVKVDQEPVSKFLEAVKNAGEMKEGDSYVFAFGTGNNAFSFSAHGKEYFKVATGSVDEFTKIWFGKAPDSGLEGLQKDLLK